MVGSSFASSVEALVESIEKETAGPLLSRDIVTLDPAIWRSLAEGKPASPDDLAAATGRPIEEIVELVEQTSGLELDRENRILGKAITLLPTRHRIQLPERNHSLYAWCIPDALGLARTLDESLRVTSTCEATGQPVVLEVEPTRISAAEPASAVMSWVTWFDPDDARATGCAHMNLFASADAAIDYQAGYPHVVNVPVAEVFDGVAPVLDALDRLRGAGLTPRGEAASSALASSGAASHSC